ncbi:1,4-alpha-glucan branching protein GlgB [Calidifontibacter sp. DB0510]|uniref:1,4-alpha-glucan branching enzyme GlgB n=1 Tax=Metallococcus carri TaxID=1656884 RepID=A0A967B1Q6_9MICO|nr:1,4-alpha-glucan branching protein GlgB [Metallococcus carri]NHN55690.1 1,4-alpha-glucan branching protein GlgB [Metallococcus carri]NOP38621.1 1,4-alpha-glucan branching protein GlgB [Calidifontibacter sp. DB2511S]
MAIVHRATLNPSKRALVQDWIGEQRWYVGKSGEPSLRPIGSYRFDDPDGEVGLEVSFLLDESGKTPTLYQVPLTYRAEPLAGAEAALIGTSEHSVLGTRYVYDGCHDPVFAAALLHTILTGASQAEMQFAPGTEGVAAGPLPPTVRVQGSGSRERTLPRITGSRVLSGEQSNTSIIIDTEAEDGTPKPLIVKVFRVLQDGLNPDVQLQSALSAAGSDRVPTTVGHLTGQWPDERMPTGNAAGHLAFAQEFLPGVRDAWREALDAARDDTDWSEPARMLGRATAEVHRTLARALPTVEPSPSRIAALLAGMRARFEDACDASPTVAQYREGFHALLEDAQDAKWPAMQRIHGDYHLGQVLDAPHRGWVLLDFEGEPLRPLAERSELDSPLRDVAGMLRSFDYAAASVEGDRAQWAAHCRHAFLEGYAALAGIDLAEHQPVLDAFEADKAAYEVTYEAANRPSWLPIPLGALGNLLRANAPRRPGATALPRPKNTEPPHPGIDPGIADSILAGTHTDPHSVLGGQTDAHGAYVRTFRPMAAKVHATMPDGARVELRHDHEGFWSGRLPGREVPDYRIATDYGDGYEHVADDPYRFLPSLGEMDLHLIGEGRHEELWTVLGAHVRRYDGPQGQVTGTSFAVWAPNALGVRVIGDFNQWDGYAHPMRRLGGTGVWEIFVPDVGAGTRYKFNVLCADHVWRAKADPMARFSETAPSTASIVTESHYEWGDAAWMEQRSHRDPHDGPMSIYEVHPTSWRQGQSYDELAEHLVNYVKDLGFTHVEFMPIMEHPYPPSWGYHVTGYYSPNSRMGDPDGFRRLVDTLHRNGIGVILDWVPGHFATDEWALARFDGTPLYEHPDPRRGWHKEWGSYIFDFGRPQVRNFLVANALYWLQEFHADGLRVDGVASMLYLDYSRNPGEWVPNIYGGRENLEAVRLLQETNATAYRRSPGTVMIAEESTSWPGVTRPTSADGLGFGFKWNMGWMHDSLDYLAESPINRQYHHHKMTFSLVYAWSEQYVLPISHDEVVHGKGSLLRKMPGDRWEQLANLRAFLGYMWSHPGKQLLFMGSEFAQESEWADGRSLDWWLLDQPAHWGVHALVKDLNRIYKEHPALWDLDNDPSGFTWLDADDSAGNTFSYLRYGRPAKDGSRDIVAALVNLSGSEHRDVRVGLPLAGRWDEVLNTDASGYGGGGRGNLGAVEAIEASGDDARQGQPAVATVTLPPLSTIWLTPAKD